MKGRRVFFLTVVKIILFILICSPQFSFACSISDQDRLTGGQCVEVNGAEIYFHIQGKGPSVIFENGLGQDLSTWNDVIPQIARFAQVVTYDREYVGKSEHVSGAYKSLNAQDIVNDLNALLMKAHIKPPYILVGHSIGGLYMQLFAREYPKEVAGVVLVDSSSVSQFMTEKVSIPDKHSPFYPEVSGIAESIKQVEKAPPFPAIKLIVLTATYHGEKTAKEQDAYMVNWMQWQNTLASLSPNNQHIVAEDTGHYIQNQKPWLVVAAIDQIIHWDTNHRCKEWLPWDTTICTTGK